MSDERLPGDGIRDELSALRSWEPASDDEARARARATLQSRIDAARAGAESELVEPDQGGEREPRARSRSRSPRWRRESRVGQRLGRRFGRWAAGLTAAVVVLAGGGTVAAVLLRTQHTQHLPVFDSHGRLSSQFKVGGHARGYCFSSSLATEDGDAYRCMAGNAILDPCFAATAAAGSVACFENPWGKVTMLTLTRQLPRDTNDNSDALPWAIVTADHRRCVFLTGATAPMGGQRINYGCVGGSFLIGAPNRSKSLWTIRYARRYIPGDKAPLDSFPIVAITQTIG